MTIIKNLVGLLAMMMLFSCTNKLTFTSRSFYDLEKANGIPEVWRGQWYQESYGGVEIFGDSLLIPPFEFKFYLADSLKGSNIYFKDNYCYIQEQLDSTGNSFHVYGAELKENGDIWCWNFDPFYLLKKRKVNSFISQRYIVADGKVNLDSYVVEIDGVVSTLSKHRVFFTKALQRRIYKGVTRNAVVTNEMFCNGLSTSEFNDIMKHTKPTIKLEHISQSDVQRINEFKLKFDNARSPEEKEQLKNEYSGFLPEAHFSKRPSKNARKYSRKNARVLKHQVGNVLRNGQSTN
jgi:hypothetical protein